MTPLIYAVMKHFTLESATGKNNRFPILDILGYLKNTHKNPKFGKVRQVPTREFPTKFPGWDLSHSSKSGILWVFFKYPKISKNGNQLFFPVCKPTPNSWEECSEFTDLLF